jgi:Transposase, Mutator family
MAEPRDRTFTRLEQAASSAEPDVLRDALRWAIEELMEADVTTQHGAAPNERTPERTGYPVRPFDSRMGALEARDPSLPGPRRRARRPARGTCIPSPLRGTGARHPRAGRVNRDAVAR